MTKLRNNREMTWRLAGHRVWGLAIALFILESVCYAQQINIPRIELMPNKPAPYLMRDWKRVALEYDLLIFNSNIAGQYLPFLTVYSNTVNYAGQSSFRLPSYVGSSSAGGEGINCLPAVVGASLCGIDKSNQNGKNWVLMCQEWFNNRVAEDVYLNHPSASSGDDWWYETMPNVFFYQLYSMYSTSGEFSRQSTIVADRWLAALNAMGGSSTPWHLPNANHRAWSLSTMTPNDGGVYEPEAAGTIGWILYNCYVKTGQIKYRIGAEWALECLNGLSSNPSYEIQLPYGVYAAARMNAELGTSYDIETMLNWCFNIGPLRNWGTMSGNWFGYDCSGLVGYIDGINNYAFAMNTFEQVGALVPMVRYDSRFARAVGKWVLNAANSSRLFYSEYLPAANQDSYSWSSTYDTNSCIAHEALQQYKTYTSPYQNVPGPYETGDAISGGWATTNLSLYSSSHVGIFGAIIETTDVPMILRLDVLKTDYFHASVYPTFLLFNPDSVQHFVNFDVGVGPRDLYDAAAHSFIVNLKGVSGVISLPINANSAVLVVNAPAGGTVTYDLDKMLINGTVVDYHSGQPVVNYPPRIKSLAPPTNVVTTNHSVYVYCAAIDLDNDTLSFLWHASGGAILGTSHTILWTAPDTVGTYTVSCTVSDGHGAQVSEIDTLTVVQFINHPPVILNMHAFPRKLDLSATSTISCTAVDPDNDTLRYDWSAANGSLSGSGPVISWHAPAIAGNYYIQCVVSDSMSATVTDSIGLEVRDFSGWPTGNLIAYYSFSGDANDASGNGHNGTTSNTVSANDRFGNPNSAYSFNGTSSSIVVPNDAALNFQNAITVNFWMKVGAFYPSREQYPISHGNWQNRWKFSITPNSNTLRWTVRNSLGTAKDLDSETHLALNTLYNVTGVYSGSDFEIYLNGQLDAFTSFSGLINITTYDLTMGQDLPGDNNWNFNGTLDEVRIYDYTLPVSQISTLYDVETGIDKTFAGSLPKEFFLDQNYPNPFNPSTVIRFSIPVKMDRTNVRLEIFDLLGRNIDTLVDGEMSEGYHSVLWNAARFPSGIYYCRLMTSLGTQVRKMILVR